MLDTKEALQMLEIGGGATVAKDSPNKKKKGHRNSIDSSRFTNGVRPEDISILNDIEAIKGSTP
jgi:hypothetical protein